LSIKILNSPVYLEFNIAKMIIIGTKILILTTLIVAIVYRKKYIDTPFRLMIYFLLAALATESVPRLINDLVGPIGANWLAMFNFGIHIQMAILLTMYSQLIFENKLKLISRLFVVIFVLFSIYNHFYLQNFFEEVSTYDFALWTIFMVLNIVFYFKEVLDSELILHLAHSLSFYICLGMLLYSVAFLPNIFEHNLPDIPKDKINFIRFLLNIMVYSLFIIGFIWSKPQYNLPKKPLD